MDTLKPNGIDVENAVRAWLADEIKKGGSSREELGRFFFTVTIGTAGLFVTLTKSITSISFGCLTMWSLFVFFLASIVSLSMAVPKTWELEENTDLYKLHSDHAEGTRNSIVYWFVAWLLGTGIGIFSLKF
jgi:hypothetical protein